MPIIKRRTPGIAPPLLRNNTLPVPLTLLIFFFSSAARPARAATVACLAPPSGLVGWWPGDTNENDIVGGNNPSTVTKCSSYW